MISSTGSSALDVNGIVSQLMLVERQPLQALQKQEAVVNGRIAAFGRLQGAISALQTSAEALAKASSWTAAKASVSGDGLTAAVTDGAAVAPGGYAIEVKKLAAAQSLAGPSIAGGGAAVVGTGTLVIQRGTDAPVSIVIDSTAQTLSGIRDKINAAGAGLSASLINDGTGARLTLTARDTGAANAVKITVIDDDGNATDAAGLSQLAYDPAAAAGSGKNLTQTAEAVDAEITVNGIAATSASNQVTGVIEGMVLSLAKAAPGSTNQVTVSRDTTSMKAALNDFVKSYNDLNSTVRSLSSFDPKTRAAGVLNGDAIVRSVQSQSQSILRATMRAAPGDYARLSDIGVTVGTDGNLSLNATKFDTAAIDTAKLSRLFTTSSDTDPAARGYGARFKALTKLLIGSDGLLPNRTESLQKRVNNLTQREDKINQRLGDTEQRLRNQYAALDAELQGLQSTSNALGSALTKLTASTG